MLKKVFDHVLEPKIYTSLDYEFASSVFGRGYDVGGACSAAAVVTDEGAMLVGRNMDLNISRKAAYIVKTEVKGCHRTIGLAYTFTSDAPDYENALQNGIPESFLKLIPFISTDVLNAEGLYVEINMRCSECWPTGIPKFVCTGTNPGAERVHAIQLTRFIGEHCATVDEALAYVRTLDVYTDTGIHSWNFCFLMADASGHYGVLEIAGNRIIWHDYQRIQTNFYLDVELSAAEELKAGTGRYELLMNGVGGVQSEEDMLALMKSVSYFQVYDPENCRFDCRSEFVGYRPHWTYDYVMAEENREEIAEVIGDIGRRNRALSRREMQDKGTLWESAFTEVVNCTEKTLRVRFFEDDARMIRLGFEE